MGRGVAGKEGCCPLSFFLAKRLSSSRRQEEEATAPALGRLSDEACEGDVAVQRVLRHRRACQARGGRVLRHWGTV